MFAVTAFAQSQSQDRAAEMERIRTNGLPPSRSKEATDLLSKFTHAQHLYPETMTDDHVLAASVSMVFAGSETTAIALSAVFYYLIKHPHTYENLMKELDEAVKTGIIEERDNRIVSWTEALNQPNYSVGQTKRCVSSMSVLDVAAESKRRS